MHNIFINYTIKTNSVCKNIEAALSNYNKLIYYKIV